MKIYKITEEPSLDYERISPVYGVSKTSGTNLAWSKALVKISEDYYKNNDILPVLVLESDANQIRPFLDDYNLKFDIPQNCDILYYGVSADTLGEKDRFSQVEGYPHLVKLKIMASSHAVCFFNIQSVKKALELVVAGLCSNIEKGGVPVDVMWSFELMPTLNAYALKNPLFVQGTSEEDNRYYKSTNIILV